jgi:tetratricopeptide (TPR) repeat protein
VPVADIIPRQEPLQPFARPWKTLLPAAGIVLLTAVSALGILRARGAEWMAAGFAEMPDTCMTGQMRYHAGLKIFRELSGDVAGRQAGQMEEASLGVLRDDARVTEMEALLQESLVLCPKLTGAHELLAAAAWWRGDRAEAHYHLGLEHMQQDAFSHAETELLTAADLDPDDPQPLLALVDAAQEAGDIGLAASYARDLPEDARDHPLALRAEGLYRMYGGHKSGFDLLMESLEKAPGEPVATRELLTYSSVSGRSGEFREFVAENLASANVQLPELWQQLALEQEAAGELQKAWASLERARTINPNSIGLALEHALVAFETEREAQAREILQDALTRNRGLYLELITNARYAPLRPVDPAERAGG